NAFTKTHNNLALLQQLAPKRASLNAKNDELKLAPTGGSEMASSLEVLPPSDASINTIAGRDQRFTYLIGGLAIILLIFAGPLWMAIHGSSVEQQSHSYPMVEPIEDPRAPALISSDSDSLFEADTAHA